MSLALVLTINPHSKNDSPSPPNMVGDDASSRKQIGRRILANAAPARLGKHRKSPFAQFFPTLVYIGR